MPDRFVLIGFNKSEDEYQQTLQKIGNRGSPGSDRRSRPRSRHGKSDPNRTATKYPFRKR